MTRTREPAHLRAWLISALALCACRTNPLEAEPPAGSAVEDLGNTLRTEVAGVELRGTVDAWPADRGIYDHVTPVHLAIDNRSGRELRINYNDIRIEDPDGGIYQILPFYRMEGTVEKPVIVSDWDYTAYVPPGFAVAAYTAPLYGSEVVIYEGPYDYDPDYYETYYRYWAEVRLPTTEMIQRALPEGVLSEGAMVDGWVYFEKIPEVDELDPVILSVELIDAESGEHFGRARLPFSID